MKWKIITKNLKKEEIDRTKLSPTATELIAKYGNASTTIGGTFVLVGDFDYRDKAKKELEDYIYSIELELNNMNFHAKALQELLTESMDNVAELKSKFEKDVTPYKYIEKFVDYNGDIMSD